MHKTEEQETAISLCTDLAVKIACVTGQAGTGKTTILADAYEETFTTFCNQHHMDIEKARNTPQDQMPFSIALCAPTGRAAKRIEEATGLSAKTIHRLLRFSVPKDDDDFGLPAHSKINPMPYDVVYVDEASMLTNELRRQVIDAMKRGSVIRFFGDINQLPPIGSSSPFAKDIEKFPSVRLTTNFRSTDGIISLADKIIRNRMPMNNDQVTIQRVTGSIGGSTVLKLAEKIDFTSVNNQIICPTNTTTHGTTAINRSIQQRFNLNKEKITLYKKDKDGTLTTKSFKRDDKILWTSNDYNLDIMNGTTGKVLDFDKENGSIYINVDNKDVEIPSQIETFNTTTQERYSYDPRNFLDLGYAISTHKSQGSQFDIVAYVLSRSRAATRQNVYTAVTRAKEKLFIINIAGSLTFALDNIVDIYNEK